MTQLTFRTLTALSLGCAGGLVQAQAAADTAPAAALVYQPIDAVPPNAQSRPARPAIMLNMSKDHQLFYRAYNEFSDYDGDGQPDGGYLHKLTYSGYFDPKKCYSYLLNIKDSRFSPVQNADSQNYCGNKTWSGNFLNWATMTRIDIVRKVLYGGYRQIDGAVVDNSKTSLTVLERASLPMDAHSFAKYYNGTDINKLTPFDETEITLCNTTKDSNKGWSHLTTEPPLLRAAKGNYALWNANERRQCRWNEEDDWDNDGEGNNNQPNITTLNAANINPSKSNVGLGGADFIVRVEVCNNTLLGTERCRKYPSGNYKPIGLLQEYGESNRAEFGLITGSFSRNISGGVLRKNLSSFRDEVIHTADGTFDGRVVGIVGTLNKLRVWGYRYSDGLYSAKNNDTRYDDGKCEFGLTSLADNQCASWGNPMGEMFTETLRYLKGRSSTGYGPALAYGKGEDPKGDVLGLPRPAWNDPFTRGIGINAEFGLPQCRPINIINFNASVTSYDRDTQGPFSDLGAASSLDTYTNTVGLGEGINGTQRFAGRVNDVGDKSCTAKFIDKLSNVDGLCPVGSAYRGSFTLAGAAYWAHTNPIRTMTDFPLTSNLYGPNKDPNFRVDTHSVALAPGLPRIEVMAPAGKAIIQPSFLLKKSASQTGSGALVNFRVISQTATAGKYLVIWEDSEQGGDYDQDMAGILEWSLNGNTLKITTFAYEDSTNLTAGFGYTISGTDKDGVHYHTGINKFNFDDGTNLVVKKTDGTAHSNIKSNGGCNVCNVDNDASVATYNVSGNAALYLEDPLFYAAKWGGYNFSSGGSPDLPDTADKWDSRTSNGLAGSDGVPDNYSVVFNPKELEDSLRRVIGTIVSSANASPAVSARQLTTGTFKYVAEFDQSAVSGDVKAYEVQADGNFKPNPTWRLGEQLASADKTKREIITNDGAVGMAFNLSSLPGTDYWSRLNSPSDDDANDLVNYLRGDRSRESNSNGWRERPKNNILGPIVNAAPWIQTRPLATYFDNNFPGYTTFMKGNLSRKQLLWAASNDGMVHAVEAASGTPVMSYVPGMLAPRLVEQIKTDLGVRAFADGSPFTGDVDLLGGTTSNSSASTANWRTYLFGTLGRGGRGVYALDVTDVSSLTEENAKHIFKWQFTSDDDEDLGHILSDVSVKRTSNQAAPIAKLNNGQFAIITGNGYQSTNGKAALMILPAQGPVSNGTWTGKYYKILTADSDTGNGLSTPSWLDSDNNGTADFVYAGDLKGNLWKFDISSADPAKWKVAFEKKALYIATGTEQLPISTAPELTFPPFGGVMVTFATGLSTMPGEFPRTDVTQRIYGIWDREAFAPAKPELTPRPLPTGVSTLVKRKFRNEPTGVTSVDTSDPTTIDYHNLDGEKARDGWYAELPGTSEMVISNPSYNFSNIFMVSISNNSGSSCTGLPNAKLYLFDPVTGLPNSSVLGQTKNGNKTDITVGIPISDQKVTFVVDATTRPTNFKQPHQAQGATLAVRVTGEKTDESIEFKLSEGRISMTEKHMSTFKN